MYIILHHMFIILLKFAPNNSGKIWLIVTTRKNTKTAFF